MSELLAIEAIAGPAIIAGLVLRHYLPGRGAAAGLERAGFAIGLAVGFTSVAFFAWRALALPLRLYPAFDLTLQALLLAGATRLARRRRATIPHVPAVADRYTPYAIAAWALAAVGIGAGILLFLRFSIQLPRGEWDAWAIWNLRAAFLSAPDHHWRDGFVPDLAWTHPDYPLLVPASVARLWSFGENGSTFGPRLVAGALLSASVLVMAGSIAMRAGRTGAALAVALLIVPSYVFWSAAQVADVPLGAYVLVAIVALSGTGAPGRYAVAGLAAGFAAWTKNEGLIALIAIAIAAAATVAVWQRAARPHLLPFVAGIAIAGAALAFFRLAFAPPSDLLHQILSENPVDKASQGARHLFVAGYLAREFYRWGGLTLVPASALIATCVAIAAFRWRHVPADAVIGAWVLTALAAAYYVVYVLTPYDLEWHLRTSAARLIAQLWPAIVWTAVVAISTPAKAER